MGLADPGRLQFRAKRNDQQRRQDSGAGHHSIEQIQRRRVYPVDVLEYDQHGTLRRYAVDLVEKGGKRHFPLLLRADRQSQQHHVAGQIFRRRLEQALQPVELCSRAAARLEVRGPLELRDERMEWTPRVVW
jgi:hypothetical protein